MAKDLRQALVELQAFKQAAPEDRIIFSERDIGIYPKALAIWFLTLYRDLGFKGASSHSGRRRQRDARQSGGVGGGDGSR
jgi:hypothetical protein